MHALPAAPTARLAPSAHAGASTCGAVGRGVMSGAAVHERAPCTGCESGRRTRRPLAEEQCALTLAIRPFVAHEYLCGPRALSHPMQTRPLPERAHAPWPAQSERLRVGGSTIPSALRRRRLGFLRSPRCKQISGPDPIESSPLTPHAQPARSKYATSSAACMRKQHRMHHRASLHCCKRCATCRDDAHECYPRHSFKRVCQQRKQSRICSGAHQECK